MHLSNIKIWNFRKFGSDEENSGLDLNFTKGLNMLQSLGKVINEKQVRKHYQKLWVLFKDNQMKRITFEIEDDKHSKLMNILNSQEMTIRGYFNLLISKEIEKFLQETNK